MGSEMCIRDRKKFSLECFVVIFFSFYFLSALQSDHNSNRVYVLGHKYFLGPSQTHFSPRLAARAKMSMSRAQNIFMPANINSIVIIWTCTFRRFPLSRSRSVRDVSAHSDSRNENGRNKQFLDNAFPEVNITI